LKLNGTPHPLVYAAAYDEDILGGSIHIIKKHAETLVVSKDIGLEVNADKIKYVAMS